MLTQRYMTSTKNIGAILKKITEGTAPDKFTVAHLKGIGFKSSNDQGIIGLLKDLGFLTADGVPTARYHAYRDKSRSRAVLGEAVKEAYADIFHINETPTEADKEAIEGKFKSVHNATDLVAERQARTFLALLSLADLTPSPADEAPANDETGKPVSPPTAPPPVAPSPAVTPPPPSASHVLAGLRYNIEIHLPATKDAEVFSAIFKSLREHLLEA